MKSLSVYNYIILKKACFWYTVNIHIRPAVVATTFFPLTFLFAYIKEKRNIFCIFPCFSTPVPKIIKAPTKADNVSIDVFQTFLSLFFKINLICLKKHD